MDARQELDLKIGVAFSRLMTRAFLDLAKEKFRMRDIKVISFGPCQVIISDWLIFCLLTSDWLLDSDTVVLCPETSGDPGIPS